MIVTDASVLVHALADDGPDDGPDGDRARDRLRGEELLAPQLVDLEVSAAIRRHWLAGRLTDRRAGLALRDLTRIRLARAGHVPLLSRGWELRQNVTSYDAAYIALAELFGCRLLTADAALARAPGVRCTVEVLRSEFP